MAAGNKNFPGCVEIYMKITMLLWTVILPFCTCYAQSNMDDYNRGLKKYLSGDYKEALIFADKAVTADPGDVEAFNLRGLAYYRLKLYRQAIEDFDKTLQLDPGYAKNYFFRGASRFQIEDFYGALADFERQLKLFPNDAINYGNRGNAKYHLEDYQGALDDVNKAIELKPGYANAYSIRGGVKVCLDQYQDAVRDLNKAIELDPTNGDSFLARARARFKLGDTAGACQDLAKGMEPNSKQAARIMALGYKTWLEADSYLQMAIKKKHDQAFKEEIEFLNKAMALAPNQPELYAYRGDAEGELMDLRAAIADFGKALSIDSNSDLVFLHRGIAQFHLGQYKAALDDLKKSIQLNPNSANAWLYAGYSDEGLNDFKAALDYLDMGIKLDPTPDGYENKALAEVMLGNFKDALSVSEKALALDSSRVRAHNLRGQARASLEDYKGALEDFNFVLIATPDNARALFNRAAVKLYLQDKAGGCADYQQSLKYGGRPDAQMAEDCK